MDHDRPAGAGARRHLRVVDDAVVREAASVALDSAREYALSVLTARPRTAHELADALARKGVDPAIAAEVLERLTAVGLVDDAAYARAYAERESGRRGPRAVAQALQRRGVAPALAREVAFVVGPEEVRAAALEVGRSALPRWRGLAPEVAQRRLAGLLARRGYPQGLVFAVVRELLGERGTGTGTGDGLPAPDDGSVSSTDAG